MPVLLHAWGASAGTIGQLRHLQMNPLVSVVIPAFNHAPFVGEAIQSILNQSCSDLEIVVTDDGSKDGTPDVIRQFSDPRIDLEVFAENRGAVVALNSAIRRSRGEFICYLGSDDAFLPGKLETQLQFLRANPRIAAVFGMPKLIDERSAPLGSDVGFYRDTFNAPFQEGLRTRQHWLRRFFFRCNCLCHPTVMMRRSVYDEVGLFDPRLANLPDFDMWVRLCASHEIHVMPVELTAMRILDDHRNMSAPRNDTVFRAQIEYYQVLKHYRRFPRKLISSVFARDIAENHLMSEGPPGVLLAELAMLGQHSSHKLFALDTMFEEISASDGNYRRLFEVTGSVDLFGVQAARDGDHLSKQLKSAHAEIARANDAFAAAQNDATRSGADLEAAQSEIARLNAALESEQAGAARLGVALHAAQAEFTRLTAALGAAQSEIARLSAALESRKPGRPDWASLSTRRKPKQHE